MKRYESVEKDVLVGEVLTHVDVDETAGEILLTTKSGRQFMLHHEQDCCESVTIKSTEGDWKKLLHKKLKEVKWEEEGDSTDYGTCTRTDITFIVNRHTVVSKWFGESNGYYSESVHLKEVFE